MATAVEIASSRVHAWAAVATATPKEAGQDRAAVLSPHLESTDGAGLVICDGVGQFDGSGDVAEDCVSLVRRHVATRGFPTGVLTSARAANAQLNELPQEGATTLIALAIDSEGYAFWTLVGNGSIFELEAVDIRGERAQFAIAELALPHISYADGRPALRSTLPAQSREFEVSGGMLLPRSGARAFLACSDGIATNEDWQEGRASDGSTLLKIPETLVVVLDHLSRGWTGLWDTVPPGERLQDLLDAALAELLADDALEDDASIGVVLALDVPR